MTNTGALHFEALLTTKDFEAGLAKLKRDIQGAAGTVKKEASEIDNQFAKMGQAMGAYFTAQSLLSFTKKLIEVRGEFQKTEIAFGTMLGNGDKAKELMGQMVDLAAKTPFSLQEVSSGAKQLLAFQVPAEQVVDTLRRMGDIAAGLGVPLERINLVYGQVKAKGRLMGDDLRQFTEAGIPMVAELAKKFNTTTAAISQMVTDGKIGFKDVQEVLFNLTNEGGMFFNLMEKQSASVSGQVSNIGDAFDQMLNKIGEANDGLIKTGLDGILYLVEHYQDVAKTLATVVAAYGAYRAAVMAANLMQKGAVAPEVIQGLMNLVRLLRGATAAQAGLNAVTLANPYILLATAVGALVAAYVGYGDEMKALIGISEKLSDAQRAQKAVMESYDEQFSKGAAEKKASITELIGIIKNENSTMQQREAAYKRLIAIDSAFVGALDGQYRATYRLGDAFDYVIGKIDAFAMAQAKAAAAKKFLEDSFTKQFQAGATKQQMEDAGREAKMWRAKDQEARRQGKASLDYMSKAYDAEHKRNALAKQWRKEQDAANESTRTSNALIRMNNAEISNKTKLLRQYQQELKKGKLSGEMMTLRQRQIDQLQGELGLLNPKEVAPTKTTEAAAEAAADKAKKKTKNKTKEHQQELAEVVSMESIIALERRVQDWNAALERVHLNAKGEKVVNVFKQDKFGKQIKTKEEIPLQEAINRARADEEKLAAARAEVKIRTFAEEIAETKRQIEVRDKLLQEGYSKDYVDSMFPQVKDTSYVDWLTKTEAALKAIKEPSQQAMQNLLDVQAAAREYRGDKTFVEALQEKIEKLRGRFSGDELIEQLERMKKVSLNTDGRTETAAETNERKKIIDKEIEAEMRARQQQYDQWINDYRSAQDIITQIHAEAEKHRQQISEDSKLSDSEIMRYSSESVKQEAAAVSQVYISELQNSGAWEVLFNRTRELSAAQIDMLVHELEKKASKMKLTPKDLAHLKDSLNQFKEQIAADNPFLGLKNSFEELMTAMKSETDGTASQAVAKFGKIAGAVGEVSGAVNESIQLIQPLREYMSDAANDTIDTIQNVANFGMMMGQAVSQTATAVSAALDQSTWSNWITAIIQLIYLVIKAIVSLLTWIYRIHDKKLEKQIKANRAAVDALKASYDDLGEAIKRALGDDTRRMQLQQIKNLEEQNRQIQKMRDAEDKKKKTDKGKLAEYDQQIRDNKAKMNDLQMEIVRNILQTDAKDAASKLGDALVDAFSRGEDASQAMKDTAISIIQDIVKNAMKMKLQTAMQPLLDNLLTQLGFDANGVGDFKGLTPEQIAAFQSQVAMVGQQGQQFLDAYKQLFQGLADPTKEQGMKGDIKGISEKTAGVLEGQVNTIRIHIVTMLQNARESLLELKAIQWNTSKLHNIDRNISELNNKTKKGLAGL